MNLNLLKENFDKFLNEMDGDTYPDAYDTANDAFPVKQSPDKIDFKTIHNHNDKYESIMVDNGAVKTAVLFPSNSPYAKPIEEFERWRDSNINDGKRREIDTNSSYAEARSYAAQLKSGL